ncbi:MAG: LysR family transcriptional regulator [Oscillospiraceae bacterium]|nr:LysR family transcriptional regulator [Oscillospiraceae bacterium]
MDIGNLELYKVFYTVALTQNITKAAQALFIGQPSVSKSIRRLEESLQVQLFIRSKKGVVLTEDGAMLFRHVEQAMQALHAGETALKKHAQHTAGKLTMGVSTPIYQSVVLPHLKGFLEEHADVAVNIVDNSKSYEILDAVKSGLLDLGMLSRPPVNITGIAFIPITHMEEIVVAAPSYLSRFDTSDRKSFLEQISFISIGKGNIMRDYSDLYLSELKSAFGVEVKPEIFTSNMNFIIELAMLEVGIGIVYRQLIEQELRDRNLVLLDFLPPIQPREICIVLKKNELRTAAIQEFVAYYSGLFAQENEYLF